jgi:hypothetical protein
MHLPVGGDARADGVQRRHARPDVDCGARHVCAVRASASGATGGRSRLRSRSASLARLFGAEALPVVQFVGDYFWDAITKASRWVTLEMLKQTYLVPTQDVGARLPLQRHGWH